VDGLSGIGRLDGERGERDFHDWRLVSSQPTADREAWSAEPFLVEAGGFYSL